MMMKALRFVPQRLFLCPGRVTARPGNDGSLVLVDFALPTPE
jgi:hypothetical protein